MDRTDPQRIHRKEYDPRASLEAINRGIEYIKEGFSLAIFPEGTRSKVARSRRVPERCAETCNQTRCTDHPRIIERKL